LRLSSGLFWLGLTSSNNFKAVANTLRAAVQSEPQCPHRKWPALVKPASKKPTAPGKWPFGQHALKKLLKRFQYRSSIPGSKGEVNRPIFAEEESQHSTGKPCTRQRNNLPRRLLLQASADLFSL